MVFLDISTATANTTSIKRGDYNLALSTVITVNKSNATDSKIRRGYALGRSDLVTPNEFGVTAAKEAGTVVISALPFAYVPDNVNVTDVSDGTGEDISADDDDVAIQGILKGRVAVMFGGSVQPGQQVMTAASGEFVAYDDSGVQYIKGIFLGKPGTQAANIIKAGVADGEIGIIDFNGGA